MTFQILFQDVALALDHRFPHKCDLPSSLQRCLHKEPSIRWWTYHGPSSFESALFGPTKSLLYVIEIALTVLRWFFSLLSLVSPAMLAEVLWQAVDSLTAFDRKTPAVTMSVSASPSTSGTWRHPDFVHFEFWRLGFGLCDEEDTHYVGVGRWCPEWTHCATGHSFPTLFSTRPGADPSCLVCLVSSLHFWWHSDL